MTGSGMRKSSSGAASIIDGSANSGSGSASISGGMAAASNGSRGGMAVQTDGNGGSNAGISSTARQGSAQANVTALLVDKSKFPVKVRPCFENLAERHDSNQDASGRYYNT